MDTDFEEKLSKPFRILQKWTDISPRMTLSPVPGPLLGKSDALRSGKQLLTLSVCIG